MALLPLILHAHGFMGSPPEAGAGDHRCFTRGRQRSGFRPTKGPRSPNPNMRGTTRPVCPCPCVYCGDMSHYGGPITVPKRTKKKSLFFFRGGPGSTSLDETETTLQESGAMSESESEEDEPLPQASAAGAAAGKAADSDSDSDSDDEGDDDGLVVVLNSVPAAAPATPAFQSRYGYTPSTNKYIRPGLESATPGEDGKTAGEGGGEGDEFGEGVATLKVRQLLIAFTRVPALRRLRPRFARVAVPHAPCRRPPRADCRPPPSAVRHPPPSAIRRRPPSAAVRRRSPCRQPHARHALAMATTTHPTN